MGAQEFFQRGKGKTAQEAFYAARNQAAYEHGHGGYTGTLAEKSDYVVIEVPAGVNPSEYAIKLVADGDDAVDDKWGPAGCVKIDETTWLFFGWASA